MRSYRLVMAAAFVTTALVTTSVVKPGVIGPTQAETPTPSPVAAPAAAQVVAKSRKLQLPQLLQL